MDTAPQSPRLAHCITAQSFLGDAGVIACSVSQWNPRMSLGPHVAFLLRTNDRGKTWVPVPMTRDVRSFLRYLGFPVWPPEFVLHVEAGARGTSMMFRDEWVIYEPGGESLWTAALSRRGLWRLRRIRRMQYENSVDDSTEPAAIPLQLPEGFKSPDAAFVERVAAHAYSYKSVDAPGWLWPFPGLALGMLIGAGAIKTAIGLIGAAVISIPVIWFLLDRRRLRREARALSGSISMERGPAY